MKKLLIAAALVLGSAVSAMAQFANVGGASAASVDAPDAYAIFSVGYDNWTWKYDGGDSQSTNGAALQYTSGKRIMDTNPLYFEWGIRAGVGFWSDSEGKYEQKLTTVYASIPLNVAYRIAIGDGIGLTPYTGLHARGNIVASLKKSYDGESDTYNLFDKDDMGGSDNAWKRFQFGWQIGARCSFNTFHVGVEYGLDFNELAKKCKTSSILVSIGFDL